MELALNFRNEDKRPAIAILPVMIGSCASRISSSLNRSFSISKRYIDDQFRILENKATRYLELMAPRIQQSSVSILDADDFRCAKIGGVADSQHTNFKAQLDDVKSFFDLGKSENDEILKQDSVEKMNELSGGGSNITIIASMIVNLSFSYQTRYEIHL